MTAAPKLSVTSVADVETIRRQFPAMARMHRGQEVAYLDGPGGTQVPRHVAERMEDYLYHHNANTHWRYPTSEETDALILDARRALADYVNGSPDEIVFGNNMTTLTFHLARALARGWSPGDEVVVTELDHHANVAPWRALEKDRGIVVRMARMRPEDGSLDLDDLEKKITKKTRLLAVGAASNALGTIVDIPRVARIARANNALLFVDAVHYAAHSAPDVREFDCDFLACSAYKFYGPHIGVLWGRRQLIERLDAPKLAPAPEESPERLETGTLNQEGMIGAGAAVDFIASLQEKSVADPRFNRRHALETVHAELHKRNAALFRMLWNGLGAIKGVTRFGLSPDKPRTPTISFRIAGKSADDVAVAFAGRGLFVSHGDFYAATVIERLGVPADGVVRVGCSAYTTQSEIERVIEAADSLRE